MIWFAQSGFLVAVTADSKRFKAFVCEKKTMSRIAIATAIITSFLIILSSCTTPTGTVNYSLDKPVDRLVVVPFSYTYPPECPVFVTKDQRVINQWKDAFHWMDKYAICCDEDTTHTIVALQDGQIVYSHSYGGMYSGYNNPEFSWQQRQLVNQLSGSKNYCYTISVRLSTDFNQLRSEMQAESDWILYKHPSDRNTAIRSDDLPIPHVKL